MAHITRDDMTGELSIRFMESQILSVDARSIVAQVEGAILKFLVKEFTDKHGQNIIDAVHESDISSKIADHIAADIQKKLKGESNEPT